jgi:hypothetical protein
VQQKTKSEFCQRFRFFQKKNNFLLGEAANTRAMNPEAPEAQGSGELCDVNSSFVIPFF